MRTSLFSLAAIMLLLCPACSKKAADSAENAPGAAETPPTPKLLVGNEQLSVTQKPGPEQTVDVRPPKPDGDSKKMAPQPVLINGQLMTPSVPQDILPQSKNAPVSPVRLITTQTPAIRSEARIEAMEVFIKSRQAAQNAGKK